MLLYCGCVLLVRHRVVGRSRNIGQGDLCLKFLRVGLKMHLVVCEEAQKFALSCLSCLSFRPLAMLVGLSGHGPSHILQRPHVS